MVIILENTRNVKTRIIIKGSGSGVIIMNKNNHEQRKSHLLIPTNQKRVFKFEQCESRQ